MLEPCEIEPDSLKIGAAMSIKGGSTGDRVEFLSHVFPSLTSKDIKTLREISLGVHYDDGELIAQVFVAYQIVLVYNKNINS